MKSIDEHLTAAPPNACFRVAADVESWPRILSHYRWVRFRERRGFGRGRVEMAAWRRFAGPLRYPTWWVSEMESDESEPCIHYRHVEGMTRGMVVRWEFGRNGASTRLRIVHEWDGPDWPFIGAFAASSVIGPHFVSTIARATLAGVAAEAERLDAAERAMEGAAAQPDPASPPKRLGER